MAAIVGATTGARRQEDDRMSAFELEYDRLPGLVKHNLTAEQWDEARRAVVAEGMPVPETTVYLDLKNGQSREYSRGDAAPGPLLAMHDLAGGRGQDSAQFHTAPPGAHTAPPEAAIPGQERSISNLETRLEPGMPVLTTDGEQLGIVDHRDQGNSVKVIEDGTGRPRWVSLAWVVRVDAAVYLDRPADAARREWNDTPPRSVRREGS
jgi:hypothetical protein